MPLLRAVDSKGGAVSLWVRQTRWVARFNLGWAEIATADPSGYHWWLTPLHDDETQMAHATTLREARAAVERAVSERKWTPRPVTP